MTSIVIAGCMGDQEWQQSPSLGIEPDLRGIVAASGGYASSGSGSGTSVQATIWGFCVRFQSKSR